MWWWESVAWGSTGAMVWGTCAHVGWGQDYFLRLAMAQVCGDCSWGSQTCGNWVTTWCSRNSNMEHHVIPEAHSNLDWHIIFFLQQ